MTRITTTSVQNGLLLLLSMAAFGDTATADVLRFNEADAWSTWASPTGVLVQNDDGSITLNRVDQVINAVSNATEFLHAVKQTRDLIPGGVRGFSNEATVDNLIDGRADTYWQPSPSDVLDDWWIEVNLGRMVYATKITLTFPNTADAVPFRNFSLFVNDGERSTAAKDVFQFTRVGRTTSPNDATVVEYTLRTLDPGPATGEYLQAQDTLSYAPVQYIRFVPEEIHDGAALAEVEVEAIGDNVALGTVERGGSVRAGTSQGNSALFSDGDHNSSWALSGATNWEESGHWYEWDLGATFWIDRMIIEVGAPIVYNGLATIKDFSISTSDGTVSGGLTTDRIRSNFDYDHLTLVDASQSPVRAIYDLKFEPRKTRHVFFHRVTSFPWRVFYTIIEHAVYGDGYLAEVEMTSDFIDLGGTSSVRRLTWDADLPPDTYVEIRSQSGDTFIFEQKFYNKNGVEISEAQWNKLPKSQKMDIVEIQRAGTDWSGWSQPYVARDAVFLSPSPRRYVQLQVKLGNDNPDVTPVLREIALHFDDALISGGVTSRILPREAGFDSLQTFTYTLNPSFRNGDLGFDRVQIQTPSPIDDVQVRIAGEPVQPLSVTMMGDSLQVDLPEVVQRDSVEVEFQARIQSNATQFDSWVSVATEDLQQGVRAEDQHASTVFVPSVASGGRLIRQIHVSSIFSPNGDGINDEAVIDFVLAKVEATQPAVTIYDLAGRQVRTVASGTEDFRWDGLDDEGRLAPPGAYVCRIVLDADVGEEAAHRLINVVY
jgi:hypothetical protein